MRSLQTVSFSNQILPQLFTHRKIAETLVGYEPISDRVFVVRLKAKPRNITLIQVYGRTTAATDEEMERFYQGLPQSVKQVPKGDMLLVMGDFNAKVGRREPSVMSSAVGLYGLGETNEVVEQLEDICLEHKLALANTMFKQHPMRLYARWQHSESFRLHLNCAKMENKIAELSHVFRSRLRHRSSVACGDAESQAA